MPKINLKDIYPHIHQDTYIEISDEVEAIFAEEQKMESAYKSKLYYHHAQYSLDCNDGIEHCATFISLSPEEIYERKLTNEQMYEALATLPCKQATRIYAHYFMGLSKTAIANREGVSEKSVRVSIQRGLCSLEKYLKNNF